jgi:hypothetical protein
VSTAEFRGRPGEEWAEYRYRKSIQMTSANPYAGIIRIRFNGYDLRPCATPA